ncbi:MAG: transcription factor S [Aigarchaeota archaeon]|nr:transcription factor S [Aigarchaeota archaeon]
MEFCPKCGGILSASKRSGGNSLRCRKCGFEKSSSESYVTIAKFGKKRQGVAFLIEDTEAELHPKTTDIQCPACGNREAYWWSVQTRSADEPTTQFFRCTGCGHTWREYA